MYLSNIFAKNYLNWTVFDQHQVMADERRGCLFETRVDTTATGIKFQN